MTGIIHYESVATYKANITPNKILTKHIRLEIEKNRNCKRDIAFNDWKDLC